MKHRRGTESSNLIGGAEMCKMMFGMLVLVVSFAGVANADDQADARRILDEGIKAQGDEAVQSKFVAATVKSEGTSYEGDNKTPVAFDGVCQGFDKMRVLTFDGQKKLTGIEIVNGTEGSFGCSDQPTEKLTGAQLAFYREAAYVNWATMLIPLKAQEFHLSLLDEMPVAGRKAVGILVSHDKHDPLKMYFDKETHLLVRYQRKFKNPDDGKETQDACVYSDFREVQGTKQPFKAISYTDGVKSIELVTTEIKLHEKPLDEKLFSKP